MAGKGDRRRGGRPPPLSYASYIRVCARSAVKKEADCRTGPFLLLPPPVLFSSSDLERLRKVCSGRSFRKRPRESNGWG